MTLFRKKIESSHLCTDTGTTFTGRKLVNPLMVYKLYFSVSFCHGLDFHMLSWKGYSSYLHVGPCHCWLHPTWTANRRLILNHKVNSFFNLLWVGSFTKGIMLHVRSPASDLSSTNRKSCAAFMSISGFTVSLHKHQVLFEEVTCHFLLLKCLSRGIKLHFYINNLPKYLKFWRFIPYKSETKYRTGENFGPEKSCDSPFSPMVLNIL